MRYHIEELTSLINFTLPNVSFKILRTVSHLWPTALKIYLNLWKTIKVDKIFKAPKLLCKTTKKPIQIWKTDLIVLDNFNSHIPKKPTGIYIHRASAKISPFLALNFKIRRFLKKWVEHFSLSSKNLYHKHLICKRILLNYFLKCHLWFRSSPQLPRYFFLWI